MTSHASDRQESKRQQSVCLFGTDFNLFQYLFSSIPSSLILRAAAIEFQHPYFAKQCVNNLNNRRVGISVYYRGIMGACGNACIPRTKGNLKQLLAYWAHISNSWWLLLAQLAFPEGVVSKLFDFVCMQWLLCIK